MSTRLTLNIIFELYNFHILLFQDYIIDSFLLRGAGTVFIATFVDLFNVKIITMTGNTFSISLKKLDIGIIKKTSKSKISCLQFSDFT